MLLLLPRQLALLLLRFVVLRALLLHRFVVLLALSLLRVVALRALLLLGIVLPGSLLGALLFALRVGVAMRIRSPPLVVVAIAVTVMVVVIVVVIILVNRDVDATRRCVVTVAVASVVGAIAAVRAGTAVVTARW